MVPDPVEKALVRGWPKASLIPIRRLPIFFLSTIQATRSHAQQPTKAKLMVRNGKKKTQKQESLPFIEPDAAGIDIGATEIYGAVPEERDIRPVRKFAWSTPGMSKGCGGAKPTSRIASGWNTSTGWDCCEDLSGLRKPFVRYAVSCATATT